MGGTFYAGSVLVLVAAASGGWWRTGTEQLVRLAAVVAAVGVIWTKAVVPVVFRPIGKALAHGARKEAESAISTSVEPQLQELRQGQVTMHNDLYSLRSQVAAILDRMPHDQ